MSIQGKLSVGCSFQIHFHNFANLSTTRNHSIASPEFTCYGHQWQLGVYPGGDSDAAEGNVSIYLRHLSQRTITASFDIKVIDKFGKTEADNSSTKYEFNANKSLGWHNFISRYDILDESQHILDDNGTLTIVVSIEEEQTDVFVPPNPLVKMMEAMFNDEATADVCFEVSTAGEKIDVDDDRAKRAKTTTPFYAHRLILRQCAPMLAAICGSNENGGVVTASVNDIKPDIFEHLLSYVYGITIPEEELKSHAKDIIDAADKYSIVNLKLEAEAAYVQSTDISFDNAMDILLYADSRNCALLKEAVMDFLADNHLEAAANISFTDCPGHVMKDLLVAVGRNSKKEGNKTKWIAPCVSDLRRKLHEMGEEVDGSREAMIETIKNHSLLLIETLKNHSKKSSSEEAILE